MPIRRAWHFKRDEKRRKNIPGRACRHGKGNAAALPADDSPCGKSPCEGFAGETPPATAFRFCRRCHPFTAHRTDTLLAPAGIAFREVSCQRRACRHGQTVGGSRNITTSGFSPPAPPACGYKLLQDTNATKPKSRDAHSFRAGRCFYLNRTRMTSTRNHIFHDDRKIRFCNESISRMLLLFRGLALLVDSRIRTTNTTLSRDVSIKSISSESRGKSYFL